MSAPVGWAELVGVVPFLTMAFGALGAAPRRKMMENCCPSIRFEKYGTEISVRARELAAKFSDEAKAEEAKVPPEKVVPDEAFVAKAKEYDVQPYMEVGARKRALQRVVDLRDSAELMLTLARNVDTTQQFSLTLPELTLLGF